MPKHLIVCLAWLAAVSASAAPVEVATFLIPMHVESESRGLFIELTREVARHSETEIHVNVLPPLRAIRGLFDTTYAVLFPALDVNFAPGQAIVRTRESIDCKEDFVFTKKGRPRLTTLADLQGKRVGITRGYPYAREVTEEKSLLIEAAVSDEVNVRKLIAGHIDAFVLDEKTGLKAFESQGLSGQMQYSPAEPVSRQDVYYAFQDTPAGKALAARFSQALTQLKANGRYQDITRGVTIGKGCPKDARR